jgi:hypothetical protein
MAIGQKQLLIPSQKVMSGFCYAFAKALLEKLKKLAGEDRVFKKKNANPNLCTEMTEIAKSVISHLCDQLNLSEKTDYAPTDITTLITTAEEFLTSFEN